MTVQGEVVLVRVVPEPGAWALLAAGLALVIVRGRGARPA